jgi:hypothetical protein
MHDIPKRGQAGLRLQSLAHKAQGHCDERNEAECPPLACAGSYRVAKARNEARKVGNAMPSFKIGAWA